MQTRHRIVVAVLVAGLLVSVSMAIHYREQAARCLRELEDTKAMLAGSRTARQDNARSILGDLGVPGGKPARTVPTRGAGVIADRPGVGAPELTPSDDATFPTNDVEVANRNWLEDLRQQDPQKYAEVMQRREDRQKAKQQAREAAAAAWNTASNYFASRKTSGMSESQLAEYNKMRDLLDETRSLLQEQPGDQSKGSDKHKAGRTVESNMVVLAEMLLKERDQEYRDLAVGMGLSETDATALVGYIHQVTSNTTLEAIFPNLGGREGGGPRGGRRLRIDRVR